LNLGLLAGIDAEGVDVAAFGCQLVDQFLGFCGIAPGDADLVAALGKPPRHGRADGITRADQQRYADLTRHGAFTP
jgi:hypothetical protein